MHFWFLCGMLIKISWDIFFVRLGNFFNDVLKSRGWAIIEKTS